jgi:hypothetical protein
MSMMEKVKDFIGITDLEEDYEEEDLVFPYFPDCSAQLILIHMPVDFTQGIHIQGLNAYFKLEHIYGHFS